MLELANIYDKCGTVCEIGPGSGRFAEEIIAAVHPDRYEMYETARDWLPHLSQLPNAVLRACDGHTLSETADGSVDLVHAQKVFVYLAFHATAGYLAEMARVVRPGGAVAFDIVTEDCLNEETVKTWVREASFYKPVPRTWAVDFMQRRGLSWPSRTSSRCLPAPPSCSSSAATEAQRGGKLRPVRPRAAAAPSGCPPASSHRTARPIGRSAGPG